MKNLNDSNMICRLEEKLAKVLMLLGMYEEAEKLICSDNINNQKSTIRSLLMAELQLLMGKVSLPFSMLIMKLADTKSVIF